MLEGLLLAGHKSMVSKAAFAQSAANVQVLTPQPGDPINEVRLLVTSQSGDYGTVNQGSDYIQSIGLNLSGTTSTTSITDTLGLLSGNTRTMPVGAQAHQAQP
jgi:hypothetical protein